MSFSDELNSQLPTEGAAPVDAFEAALAATANPDALIEDVVADLAIGSVEAVAAIEEEVAAEIADEEENDENAEFRKALRDAPGDWYVVHSYAGYEKKVKGSLTNRVTSLNMEDFIFQIEVPEEEVTEIKNGQRKQVKRNVFPGYVLVRMDLTDESWSCVRNTPGVTGFVGNAHHPSPLSLSEVENILAPRPVKAGAKIDIKMVDSRLANPSLLWMVHSQLCQQQFQRSCQSKESSRYWYLSLVARPQ